MFGGEFFFGGVGIMILSPWLVWLVFLFHRYSRWRKAHSSGGGSRPLDAYAEKGGPLAVGAAEEPEQELGDELVAKGTSTHWGNGWTASATEEDQQEVGSATGAESGDDNDSCKTAVGAGAKTDQEQGVKAERLAHQGDGWTVVAPEEDQADAGAMEQLKY